MVFGHSDDNEYFTNLRQILRFWLVRMLEEIFEESLRNP